MEHVHQQLDAIIRDLRPGHEAAGLAELYTLLGRTHTQAAMQLVDRGVACLASRGTRHLFRVGASSAGGPDVCFCMLPGRFCSACAQTVGGAPCVHVTAALVAAALARCTVEVLDSAEMAMALFSVT
ncbi:hypothetical protein GGF46_004815 [Coemansia sp. RSA 552]|nr:hypothetical protein GGF46_004815 [Coemansia sp. RSA 552]